MKFQKIASRMSPNRKLAINCLYLTSPVWALVLFFGLLCIVPGGRNMAGEPIIALGVLAIFIGAVPIYRGFQGVGGIVLFGLYFVLCAFAMFIAGWSTILLCGIH